MRNKNATPVPDSVKDEGLWLRIREKVKSRVAVWPSAYASGQVVQEYKRAGGRFYNPGKLTHDAVMELELALLENPSTGLDKWFAEKWVDIGRSIYLSGPKAGHLKPSGWQPCGRDDADFGKYPKCRPLAEAKRMTPRERLYAVKRKREAEKRAPSKRGRKPIMVKTYKNNPEDNPRSKYDAQASKIAKKIFLLFKKNDIFKARSLIIDGLEEFSNPGEHYADDAGTVEVLGNAVSFHIGLTIDRRLNKLSLSGGFEPETRRLTVFAARPYRLRDDVDMNAAYMRIYELVRHELEHAYQDVGEGFGEEPGKIIRSAIDFNDYYMDPYEIEAYAVGLYALAKKRGIPFSIILKGFKRKLELSYPKVHKRHIGRFVKAVESYAYKRYPRMSDSLQVPKRGLKELREMIDNPSGLAKDVQKLLRGAEQQGCVVFKGRKHYKVRCPEGPQITVSSTPGDRRALHKIRRDFQHAGIHLNPDGARAQSPSENPGRKKLYIQPNDASVKVAKRALERRRELPKSKRGGLDAMEAHEQGIGSGVLRARDIASGKRVNAYQVKAFFDRHRSNYVNAKAAGKKWEDSKAWQAWDLWGGEPLRKQVEKAVREDKKNREVNPNKTKKKVKKVSKKVDRLDREADATIKGAAVGTAVGGVAGFALSPPLSPVGAGAGAYVGSKIGKAMAHEGAGKKGTGN